MSLDTETTGLDFNTEKIRLVQIKAKSLSAYIFDVFKIGSLDFLKELADRTFIIHHAPFDWKMLKAHGVELQHYHDTRLMGALIHPLPNPKDGKRDNLESVPEKWLNYRFNLQNLLKLWLGVEIPKEKHVRTGWSEDLLTEEKLNYAATDVEYLEELFNVLEERILNSRLSEVYETFRKSLKVHIKLEFVGVPVKSQELIQRLSELDTLEEEIQFIEKYGIDNPNSNLQVSNFAQERFKNLELPKTVKTGQLKLNIENIESVKDKFNFFKDLYNLKINNQTIKELKKIHSGISSVSGRVHPSYTVLGASSGRTLTKEPNFQGQAKCTRDFIGVKEGFELVCADYSQQEMRIFAILSDNKDLLNVLKKGGDSYREIASLLLNKSLEDVTLEERSSFKTVALGILYGFGEKSLSERLNKPIEETRDLQRSVKRFFKLRRFQKWLEEKHSLGFVPTFINSGTRKIFDKWWTLRNYQLVNYVIQGTAANIGNLALVQLDQNLGNLGQIVGFVHDEFIVEYEEKHREAVKKITEESMTAAFIECLPEAEDQKTFLVSVQHGKHWSK